MSSSWSVPSPAYCSSIWLTNRHQRSIWLPELSPLPTSGKETQWGTRAYSSLTKHCCEVCSASGTCLLPPASTKAQEEENPQHLAGTAGPEAVHEDAPELLSRRLPSRILVKSEFELFGLGSLVQHRLVLCSCSLRSNASLLLTQLYPVKITKRLSVLFWGRDDRQEILPSRL